MPGTGDAAYEQQIASSGGSEFGPVAPAVRPSVAEYTGGRGLASARL